MDPGARSRRVKPAGRLAGMTAKGLSLARQFYVYISNAHLRGEES
jgi:hypothetical protein